MIEKGVLLKVKTRTLQDVFGEVVYEVVETGLPAPEKERKGCFDGIKAVMIGGNGPSARKGYMVFDSEHQINMDIAKGITVVLPAEKKPQVVEYYAQVDMLKEAKHD